MLHEIKPQGHIESANVFKLDFTINTSDVVLYFLLLDKQLCTGENTLMYHKNLCMNQACTLATRV